MATSSKNSLIKEKRSQSFSVKAFKKAQRALSLKVSISIVSEENG